jgi:hypothetical protein
MSELGILPRGILYKTPYGTTIEWRRGAGLIARDAKGRRRLTPEEMHDQFPLAWPAWIRFAAILPEEEIRAAVHPSGPGPRGGRAA